MDPLHAPSRSPYYLIHPPQTGEDMDNQTSREFAADWWAERFQKDEHREAFRVELLRLLNAEGPHDIRLSVDYDPEGLLLEAIQNIGIPCSGSMFSADGLLPRKTFMRVKAQSCEWKRGYGAPFEHRNF